MGLFENALMLDGSTPGKVNRGSFRIGQDMKGRGSVSVAALTLSGDMLFQGNLRLKNPNSRGSIEEISSGNYRSLIEAHYRDVTPKRS